MSDVKRFSYTGLFNSLQRLYVFTETPYLLHIGVFMLLSILIHVDIDYLMGLSKYGTNDFRVSDESKYSRMGQVKFVEDSL